MNAVQSWDSWRRFKWRINDSDKSSIKDFFFFFKKSYICWKPSRVSHLENAMIDTENTVMGCTQQGANMHNLSHE